jgi:signal peptidase II
MNTTPRRPLSAAALLWLHGAIFTVVLVLDQITKYWVRVKYSLPNGEPDYYLFTPVIGEWLQFRLVYNFGAAFGTKPQSILPFLHPTVFFALFSFVALACLGYYYYRLGDRERTARLGVLLILSGAIGNLIDRMVMHKVTDFIDVGIPGLSPRWPVFNIADSSVFIGILLLILPSFFSRKTPPKKAPEKIPEETVSHAG